MANGNQGTGREPYRQPIKAFGPEIVVATAFDFIKVFAAFVMGLGVIITSAWYLAEPRVERWVKEIIREVNDPLNDSVRALTAATSALRDQTRSMEETIARLDRKAPFIEFVSGGVIRGARSGYRAGDVVPILYNLRRNRPCKATVQARFIDMAGQTLSEYTYESVDTRAPTTSEFIAFPLNIQIPSGMRPGWYSYQFLITPNVSECPGAQPVLSPASEYFEVVRDGG